MIIGLAYSTLYGWLKRGRQERRKAHELDQNLGGVEKKILVKQIEDMNRCGFPLSVSMVREIATSWDIKWEGISNISSWGISGISWSFALVHMDEDIKYQLEFVFVGY